MWDNVDWYSSEGCLFLGVCPRNVFLKNEWANIRDSLWSFKDHCLEVEKAKDDLELNSVELPVLSFTNLSPTTSLSAPLSTKAQVTCWKSLSSPNHHDIIAAEIVLLLKNRAQYSNSPSRLPRIQILHWSLSFPRWLLQKSRSSSSWSSSLLHLHLPPARSPWSGLQRSWTSPPAHHFHLPLL